jgi:CRISPR-associated endoribonuclease Cas6
MPAIIELRLRATWPLEVTTRQLHGLACAVFESQGDDGHAGQHKPFTVWPLSPDPAQPGSGWLLRLAWLRSRLPQSVLSSYGQIRLGHVRCAVTDIAFRPATHAELAAGTEVEGARLTFHSPTYFSQNGTDVVLPDPRLITGSWRRRWNASLQDTDIQEFGDDDWREICSSLQLTNFDLRTEYMDSGRGHDRAGFTGTATVRLDKTAPPAVRSKFATLARFAEFCGTGAQTTHGFGATSTTCLTRSPAQRQAREHLAGHPASA